MERHIAKTVSGAGELIYKVTEYRQGSKAFYLVYPRNDNYSQIELEYDEEMRL